VPLQRKKDGIGFVWRFNASIMVMSQSMGMLMTNKNCFRKRYKALEPRYQWLWNGTNCYYCGQLADTKDHIPPISIAYALGADRLNRRNFQLWKVTCCKECNSVLGDRFILSPERRGKWLYEYYLRKRYKKLAQNGWARFSQEELEEFGPNLQSFLKNCEDIRSWMERRFSYMEDIFGIGPDIDSGEFNVEKTKN